MRVDKAAGDAIWQTASRQVSNLPYSVKLRPQKDLSVNQVDAIFFHIPYPDTQGLDLFSCPTVVWGPWPG